MAVDDDETLEEPSPDTFQCNIHEWEGIMPCPACADDEADRQYDSKREDAKRENGQP